MRVVIFATSDDGGTEDDFAEELAADVLEACSQLDYVDIELEDEDFVRCGYTDGRVSCQHLDKEIVYSWQQDVCFGLDGRDLPFAKDKWAYRF